MFKDRTDAGQKLAEEIKKRNWDLTERDSIILALPRGGVVVAGKIAKDLKLPLDIVVTRKIGAPLNPEYAVAAVGEHAIILNPREEIDENYLREQTAKERLEIKRRLISFRGKKACPKLEDKITLLVDDGVATGLTMEAAIKELRFYHPQKIIVAVPVAPPDTIDRIKNLVDEIIVLSIEPLFFAVGQFYQSFGQTQDDEVKNILNSL